MLSMNEEKKLIGYEQKVNTGIEVINSYMKNNSMGPEAADALTHFSELFSIHCKDLQKYITAFENRLSDPRVSSGYGVLFKGYETLHKFDRWIIDVIRRDSDQVSVDSTELSYDQLMHLGPSDAIKWIYKHHKIFVSDTPLTYDKNYHDAFISDGCVYIPIKRLCGLINSFFRGINTYSSKHIMNDLNDNKISKIFINNGRKYNTHHIMITSRPDICKQRFAVLIINNLAD